MKFKLPQIDIPADNPFLNDALQRQEAVESVASVLGEVEGPFVLAIDSPWGTGKTTFVRMLQEVVTGESVRCIYFNAWETDFAADPLVAFVGEIEKLASHSDESEFNENLNKAKKIATVLARRALPVAGKLLTSGLLDLDELVESGISGFVGDSVSDAVDAFTEEKKLIELFLLSITTAIDSLDKESGHSKLVVFVDELDRCKPTYAISLLERIKHLFAVPNVVFVLSLDKRQLNVSIEAVYGAGIDANEYLRRFVDLEFMLPPANSKKFAENLVTQFGFDDFFGKRQHPEMRTEKKTFVGVFVALSELFELSLRAREQCFTRIRVAMLKTPENNLFFPHMLVVLTILKTADSETYQNYAIGTGTSKDVVSLVLSKPGGREFLSQHIGVVTEALLIATKMGRADRSDELNYYIERQNAESLEDKEKDRANRIVAIVTEMVSGNKNPPLSYFIGRLEMAAQFER